jgi:hypothetical protein
LSQGHDLCAKEGKLESEFTKKRKLVLREYLPQATPARPEPESLARRKRFEVPSSYYLTIAYFVMLRT